MTVTAPQGLWRISDNGLDQYIAVGAAAPVYDARGNLTALAGAAYGYDIFNRMIAATPAGGTASSLAYDPAGRLHETNAAGVVTRFLYDGAQMVGEYNASNALLRRYVPGPGLDEIVVWYEGAGVSDRRWLIADERGSTIAVTDGAGAATSLYSYDEFGVPNAWSGARMRYAGAVMLPEAQLYHLRARAYLPALGRFAQTDPIGMGGGMNLYAHVGNDPVNFVDPSGLCAGSLIDRPASKCFPSIGGPVDLGGINRDPGGSTFQADDTITVTGTRYSFSSLGLLSADNLPFGVTLTGGAFTPDDVIIVTAICDAACQRARDFRNGGMWIQIQDFGSGPTSNACLAQYTTCQGSIDLT